MNTYLWIDDFVDPEKLHPGQEWTWAKTITEATRLIEQVQWAVVSLDHDIAHVLNPGRKVAETLACPEDYSAVARFIANMPAELRPKSVVIHTWNDIGAKNMMRILDGKVETLVRKRRKAS